MKPWRVVLDTNVVLSALVFSGALARIRSGWAMRHFIPLGSTATVHELLRALTYPKFGLSVAEQEELLADYLPYVEVVRIPDPPPLTPPCRDAQDLPLLQLAVAGKASAIVSGDRDLLILAGTPGLCRVLTVQAFRERLPQPAPVSPPPRP